VILHKLYKMGVDTVFHSYFVVELEDDFDKKAFDRHMNSKEAKIMEKGLYTNDWKIEVEYTSMSLTPLSNAHRGVPSDWMPWLSYIISYLRKKYEDMYITSQIVYLIGGESGVLTPRENKGKFEIQNVTVNDDGEIYEEVYYLEK